MDLKIMLLAVVVVAAYLMLFTRSKSAMNEGFDTPINTGELRKPCKTTILEQTMAAPFVKKAIMDVDDYEYNLIFQQEGDREVSKALINKLQSQYPLDWSVQPPSSAHFQAGLQQLKERFKNAPASVSEEPYTETTAQALTPPDTSLLEREERKILQLYKPKPTDDLKTYDLDDAHTLIQKIYDTKGLIPQVQKKGENIYEVVGTRRKDEKIVYEDENPPAQRAPVETAGEGTITIPAVAVDVAAGLDPYFSPSPSTRMGRWDYTKFTPGLERMFAPTYPTADWE
jgi:hypothetical protein